MVVSKPEDNAGHEIEIKIDPEFFSLLPPLLADENDGLKDSLKDGFKPELGKILTWHGIAFEGQHRLQICWELDISLVSDFIEDWTSRFSNRDGVMKWIDKHQRAKRNLRPSHKLYLIGKTHEAEKKSIGAPEGNKNRNGINVIPLNRTRARIAIEEHVSEATVSRAGKFYIDVDTVVKNTSIGVWKLLSEEFNVTQKDVHNIAALPADVQKRVVNEILDGKKVSQAINEVNHQERDRRVVMPPSGEFNVILAEPPRSSMKVENCYPAIDFNEIKSLDIPAAKDSILFLKTNGREIIKAYDLLKSWNFAFRDLKAFLPGKSIVFYLIATRGKYEMHEITTVFITNIHDLIETAYPGQKYLDLFGKNARDGWETWGDKITVRRPTRGTIN